MWLWFMPQETKNGNIVSKEMLKYNVKYIVGRLTKDVLQNLIPDLTMQKSTFVAPKALIKV